MATCGIWMTRQRLVTAVLDDAGEVDLVGASPRNDDGRRDLLFVLEGEPGLTGTVVVTESLVAADPLPRLAVARGVRVFVAPDALMPAALTIAGRGPSTAPRAMAILLARMPTSPPFAQHLRPLRHQLALPRMG